jgi:hypothetical protein
MISESARVTTAAEARFRIDAPKSRPRAVKIVALDAPSTSIVAALRQGDWNRAEFFHAGELVHAGRLFEVIADADLVVMIATAGEGAPEVAAIGRACSDRRKTTTGLIVCPPEVPADTLSRTLGELRPWMLMLVIASSVDYVEDMLHALRA